MLAFASLALSLAASPQSTSAAEPNELRVLAWNIWHGGREDGEEVGPSRVAEVIRASGADVVAMQETYGSGPTISQALGFTFHERGTNVSIHSRYPVLEDVSVHEEFKCVGALLDLPGDDRVAFYSIWLPYDAEIWAEGTRDVEDPGRMQAACNASEADLRAMHAAIERRLSDPKYDDVTVMIAGDFNSMSHLDYGEVGRDEYGMVVSWPTSHVLHRAGFRDAYRETNPRIDRVRDATWTPRFPEQDQDRIDFVYYRSPSQRWRAAESRVIREHSVKFPSDHAALLATFEHHAEPPSNAGELRACSYNVKHGYGMDGKIDLDRIADVLREQDADVIGLQEVDLACERSGGVNQAEELAAKLDMHAAFGTFMPYQGGHYGMAVLSRHPFVDARSIRLPEGNEPRVALTCEVRLPDDRTVEVVNVHFDWVRDDGFRFAQAQVVADALGKLDRPFVLMGDFNDVPESRTLELFDGIASEAAKPEGARFTIPSDGPKREIDFVFVGPEAAWEPAKSVVVDEPLASDHRPVTASLRLR